MSKARDEETRWLDGQSTGGEICGAVRNADDAFIFLDKIAYMHQVDERKMEHAAKTR